MSTTLVLTDARVSRGTVDGIALLISTTASHHLAKMVSKHISLVVTVGLVRLFF